MAFCRADICGAFEATEASSLQHKARAALHGREPQRYFSMFKRKAAAIGQQHFIPRMWSREKTSPLTRLLAVPAGHGNVRLTQRAPRRSLDANGRPDSGMRSGAREGHALGRLRGQEVRMSLSPALHASWQIAVF